MVTIIDYGTGNLQSVRNAFSRLGSEYILTSDAAVIASAERVFLPGVGAAVHAMALLRQHSLVDVLRSLSQPVLGVCLGMQLLCEHSEEGDTSCLGVIPCGVRRLEASKVPHVGWNSISKLQSPLFEGINDGEYVYYVHSFGAEICDYTIAATDYEGEFSGALRYKNFYGMQFHPEKSGPVGERILENFLKI